jgi:hypothetical protein
MTRLRAVCARVDSEPLRTPLHKIFAESFDDDSLLNLLVAGLDSTAWAILSSDKPPTEADFCKLPLARGDGHAAQPWSEANAPLRRFDKHDAVKGWTWRFPLPGPSPPPRPSSGEQIKSEYPRNSLLIFSFFNKLARKDARERFGKTIDLDKDKHSRMTVRPF